MIYKLVLLILLFSSLNSFAQNSISGKVLDEHTNEPILGVNIFILNSNFGVASDEKGMFTLDKIPNGKYIIRFSHVSYDEFEIEVTFPYAGEELVVEMEPESEELEEVYANATRSSRTIDAEPTRVEVIAGEEIDEKISMDPSNISMMLNESTGIQVQQTSAASANNTFRIQGLDGRYTQLLKDGFPLFGGFSGSLSIVQIPPLDLSQIEIIKGSSSTLYGGGAIAGLINLISKQPEKVRKLSFLVNGTSASGLDLSGFYSNRNDNYGIKILASRNTQKAYDNNDDNFSDLPQIERYSFNPELLFYFNENNTLKIGSNFSIEERFGGYIEAIENEQENSQYYFEKNNSNRLSTQIEYTYSRSENSFTLKNSISIFNRELSQKNYNFEGRQISSFSEAVYKFTEGTNEWLLGANLYAENFEDKNDEIIKRNYNDITYGVFINNIFDINEKLSLESGLRFDYNNDYGFFPLPRINLLFKWDKNLRSRLGGGLGYKIPTIFTEKSDELAYRGIIPISKGNTNAEKSFGFNFDFDYSAILFEEITISVNNLFFYTRINDPLYLKYDGNTNLYEYKTFNGFFDTKGIETNIKFTYNNYKLFMGYTFTDVKSRSKGNAESFPLTPKNKLGIVLIYEIHDNLRVGLEAYYTGKQRLSDGSQTTDYWINGLMIEKRFENFSIFLNFENFLDTRQSKYGPMFTGTSQSPTFSEIYAPTDGSIINGGIKLDL